MGVSERSLHRRTPMRVAARDHHFLNLDTALHSVTGPTIPSTILQASFNGAVGKSQLGGRTVSVKLIASATPATRSLDVRIHGISNFGEFEASTVPNISATASQTKVEESLRIFEVATAIEFLSSSSGIQAGDVVRVGYVLDVADATHYVKIFWALPRRFKNPPPRSDANGFLVDQGDVLLRAYSIIWDNTNLSWSTNFPTNSFSDFTNLRYDHEKGGIRAISGTLLPGPAFGSTIVRFTCRA